jgi:putative sporulation protein YyaC
MEFSFHIYNKLAADGIMMAVDKLLGNQPKRLPPIVVCVGSDLAVGDSLGPIAGSLLKYKTQGVYYFLYGTLAAPVTAKEIKYLRQFLKKTHPNNPIIAIDAAVGEKGDIGTI